MCIAAVSHLSAGWRRWAQRNRFTPAAEFVYGNYRYRLGWNRSRCEWFDGRTAYAQYLRYLNLLATFHGVGSLLVPLVAAWLIAVPLAWPQIYLCTAVLAIPLIGIFTLTSQAVAGKPPDGATGWSWRELMQVGFTWRMCWFYVLICAYVAISNT